MRNLFWQSEGKSSDFCTFSWLDTLFYKQPVYKQLALVWEIAKQLSGLKRLSLSSNRNCRLKKSEVFFLVINVKVTVKLTIHQNSAVSKALLGKF